jgi:hypothetical protein
MRAALINIAEVMGESTDAELASGRCRSGRTSRRAPAPPAEVLWEAKLDPADLAGRSSLAADSSADLPDRMTEAHRELAASL